MGEYKKSVTEYADVKICMRDFGELNMEKGLEKGMLAKTKEFAKKSLEEGLSMDLLSRIIGLTPEQIRQLQ